MVSGTKLARSTCLARVVGLALTVGLAGCASAPDAGRPPRTPYKGDAVYDIASGSRASHDPRAAATSHDPSVG